MKCDSHIHIYDRAFVNPGESQVFVENADVAAYRQVQAKIGTQRVVIVTPRVYGTDNAVTVDAIRQLGIDNARGVAVLNPGVTDDELAALNDGGIRGIRFTLYTAKNAAVGFDMVEPSPRVSRSSAGMCNCTGRRSRSSNMKRCCIACPRRSSSIIVRACR